jgi:membrane protein
VPVAALVLSLLSAFPMLQGMSDILEQWVFDNLMRDSADVLAKYGRECVDNAARLTAVGPVFLALTTLMLVMTMEDAFNDIWSDRQPRPMVKCVLIYRALIIVGPVFMGASLTLSSWLMSASAGWTEGIPHASATLIKCSAIALTSLALALLYIAMPSRPIRLHDGLIGGVVAGLIFELSKEAFGLDITLFPTYARVYGAFVAVPVFLLWVYISWRVVLVGAVLVASLPKWRYKSAPGHHAPGSTFVHALQVLKVM